MCWTLYLNAEKAAGRSVGRACCTLMSEFIQKNNKKSAINLNKIVMKKVYIFAKTAGGACSQRIH